MTKSAVELLAQALKMHELGRLKDAAFIYRKLLRDFPVCVNALHLLGMLHHEENDHQKGLELVSRAVELCPGNSVLLNSRAVIEMGLGRFAVAAVTLREAVDIDPANAEAQRNLGVVLRALGRIDDAWRQFNRAVELDPANGKNYLDLGEIAESRQEWWDAETLFRQAIENSCVDAGSVALGRLLNELDRSAEARDFLLGVEDSCYEHFEWNLQTGVAFGKLNRHRRAVEYLRRCVEIESDSAVANRLLSIGLMYLGQLDESVRFAQVAKELSDSRECRLHLVTVLAQSERFDDARAILRAMLDDATEPAVLEMLADLEDKAGNREAAIQLYREVLEIDPELRSPLLKLAGLCEHASKIDTTVQACVRVLKRNPNSVGAHLLLGLVLSSRLTATSRATLSLRERRELAERALEHLSRAALLEPSAETYDAWGKTLMLLGRHSEALEQLEKAIALDPEFAAAHESLGRAWLELGEMASAKQGFEASVSLRPQSAHAQFELARLDRDAESAKAAASRLENLIDQEDMGPRERMMLHFATARRYDNCGRYNDAFRHYAAANHLKGVLDPFPDIGTISDVTARTINQFGDAFFQNQQSASTSTLPVFIVGMPRSGTTLVEQILASHPQVFGAGELNDIADFSNAVAHRENTSIEFPESVQHLSSETVQYLVDQYLERLTSLRTEHGVTEEVLRVTDKMPTNYRFLGLIARLFPSARVINVQRDPRDVCVSCFKQNLLWPYCDLEALSESYLGYRLLMRHLHSVLPIEIYDVQYEALVADVETVSRGMIEYCGLEWDSRCLNYAKSRRAVQTPSKWQVRQPIYDTSVGAWRKYEKHLGELLESLES